MVNIVLAGGGTAGHTSPLLATAEALERVGGVKIVCVGTRKGLETTVVPAAGYELRLVDPVPLPRKPGADLVKLPVRLARSVGQARAVLRDHRADVLIGFGGYVSVSAYLAAFSLRVPVVIHEQNALPGVSNKLGAKFAAYTAATFPNTPLRGAEVIGMPVSRRISSPTITRAEAREFFGLAPDMPTLLVSGGSQGAQSLNRAVEDATPRLLDAGVQIVHVLGAKNMTAEHRVLTADNGASYRPVAFVDDMSYAYAAADLMFGRAGAGTVVETAMNGLPTLFVPYPHGNGEQERNAAALVAAGGGVLIHDSEVSADRLLSEVLPRITNASELAAMATACRDQSPADAADVLAARALAIAAQKGTR